MKKSLFALTALSAFASVAHAQSSVTLYGIIDEAVVAQSNADITKANAATGNPGVGGRKVFLDSVSGLQGSRWGLKAAEDLGGGLKAIFQLENGLNLNTGAFGQGGLEFGRQAYVGLSSSRYGTVTAGRQYDSVVDYIGPIIFGSQIGSVYAALPGDLSNTNNSQRTNNAIKYTSPTYNGLTFGGLYSLGGVAGSVGRNQIYSVGVGYANGPIGLAAAFLKVNQPNASYFSNSAIGAGSLGTALSSVSTPIYSGYMNANSYQVAAAGGTYAIGPANIGVAYTNTQFQNLQSGLATTGLSTGVGAQGTATFNTVEVNLTWHFTPALQIGGAYSYAKGSSVTGRNAAGIVQPFGGATYNQFSLSTDYNLSKRTDVYLLGVYQTASGIDSTGNAATADITTLTASSNNHQAVLRAGIRHKF